MSDWIHTYIYTYNVCYGRRRSGWDVSDLQIDPRTFLGGVRVWKEIIKKSVGCAPPGSWSARSISAIRTAENPKNPCLEIADPAGLELQDRSGMDIE